MIDFSADNRTARGYLALPATSGAPGVLLLHAWWGLNDTVRAFADRVAAAGFVALAPDMYGGQVATTIEDADRLRIAMDRAATSAMLTAASAFLRGHPAVAGERIGVIGFSLGGAWALGLDEAIGATVTFYGLGDPDSVTADAPIQGHFAEHDQFDSVEDARGFEQALTAQGKQMHLFVYPGTQHWFAEPDRPEYDAAAADLAWERTIGFLREHLST